MWVLEKPVGHEWARVKEYASLDQATDGVRDLTKLPIGYESNQQRLGELLSPRGTYDGVGSFYRLRWVGQ
jgi:hypothetical protein